MKKQIATFIKVGNIYFATGIVQNSINDWILSNNHEVVDIIIKKPIPLKSDINEYLIFAYIIYLVDSNLINNE